MIAKRTSGILVAFSMFFLIETVACAASNAEIDARVKEAIATFYETNIAGKELAEKANGMLVFPNVIKAGFGIGGEYGEGALLIKGETVDYYSVAAASIGLQLGVQSKTEIILFMTELVLESFRHSDGWEVGVDASVAIATIGAGGEIGTNTAREPIIGFVISNKGLMYDLSLAGSKITKLSK